MATNPFRRRDPTAAAEAPVIPQAASPAAFLESITSTPDSEDPRPTKTKVVKRVRVQSPPPLSPDSPVEARFRGGDASDDGADPFEQRFPANPDTLAAMPEAAPLVAANQGIANPFGTSFEAADTELQGTAAAASGKAGLDVNAFSRLLLTGQSGLEATAAPGGAAARLQQLTQLGGDNSTETSSISKHSFSDAPFDVPSPAPVVEVTPRTSHEATDQEREEARRQSSEQVPAMKKAPPPPSSRRSRIIKPLAREDGVDGPAAAAAASPSPPPKSPSDVNKPLPPAPRAHDTDDEVEDIFAREAAGKTPEKPDHPRSSETSSSTLSGSGKKPTPTPPPRRGHARSESKVAGNTNDDEAQPRSSIESQHSRLETSGSRHAPAPPPPRRPGVSQRLSFQLGSALASPTSPSMSEAEISPMSFPTEQANTSVEVISDDQSSTHQKIAPPPPPPARNLSTRRPNPRGTEGARRSLGGREKENTMAPPPPPPRQRGSSKGSIDAPGPISRTSFDSVRVFTPPGPEGHDSGIPEEATEEGKGADILADLDALQREVDALRGKYGNA